MLIDNDYRSLTLPADPRILVGATGSIAVTALPAYIDAIRSEFGGRYTVVMTHSATDFLTPHVAGLHADRVVHGEDPRDWPTDRPSRLAMDHDAFVVLPSTAHMLATVASGAAPNRLSTVILSAEYRGVFLPHMGPHMWHNPAVRRNVSLLRADGHHVVEPEWHSSRDVVTGQDVRHPALGDPQQVVAALRGIYRTRADTTDSGGAARSRTSTSPNPAPVSHAR